VSMVELDPVGGITDSARIQQALAKIKELFPDYAFFFDADAGGFGQDIRDLLIRAIEGKFTTARFDAEYKQTKYYKETADKVKSWNAKTPAQQAEETAKELANLQADYADLFDFEGADKIAADIAKNVARLGLTGNRLKSFVYAESLRLKPAGAKAPTLETTAADKIRNSAREYGYAVSEDEINSVLTGKPDRKGMILNENAIIERAKNAAKGLYSHLSQQIDSGLSLDDIFKNYRTYASSILEIDPNQIDWTKDPKWSAVFGNAKDGQMTLSQWATMLKSDDKYGYQFTNQAQQQATKLVMDMERAFGFRR